MQKLVHTRRIAVSVLAALLLAACRQQPTPQPLPDPMTVSAPKSVATDTNLKRSVALTPPFAKDFTPSVYPA